MGAATLAVAATTAALDSDALADLTATVADLQLAAMPNTVTAVEKAAETAKMMAPDVENPPPANSL